MSEAYNNYYTCFGRSDKDPKAFHMTHKYLGNLQSKEEIQIVKVISDFFIDNKRDMPPITFNKVDYLGPMYKRVLKPWDMIVKKHFLLDLRMKLDYFRDDDFEYWIPHITTDLNPDGLSVVFDRFFLMKNDSILFQWGINGADVKRK